MDTSTVYVGLDYHRDSIQVCLVKADGGVVCNRSVASTVQAVLHVVGRRQVRQVVIEACTGSADLAESINTLTGWTVVLAHAGTSSRMKLNPDKSDYADARLLAELGRSGFVPRVWLPPREIRELRMVVHGRRRVVLERSRIKVSILALLREQRITEPSCRRWTIAWLAWLAETDELRQSVRWMVDHLLQRMKRANEDVKAFERRLAQMTADDPVVQRLQRLPGVGPVVSWSLRAYVGDFDRFAKPKQLARYCGLTPRNHDTGRKLRTGGLIHAGNDDLKTALIQAAHNLRRTHPRWRDLARRLKAAGKANGEIVAAIANRWVRWLHTEMRRPEAPMN